VCHAGGTEHNLTHDLTHQHTLHKYVNL